MKVSETISARLFDASGDHWSNSQQQARSIRVQVEVTIAVAVSACNAALSSLVPSGHDVLQPRQWSSFRGEDQCELMDLFRWHFEADSRRVMRNGMIRRAAIEELADVVICTLAFANWTGIDLATAVKQKVSQNRRKYPAAKFKGKF